jgi:DNA polymerase III epsilon subunit-like protein
MTIVFLDTETTSLRPDRRVWEIGDIDLAGADPAALRIGRFYERHPFGTGRGMATRVYRESDALLTIEQYTRDATIVGAVPWFDTEVLDRRMRAHGILPSWHYHLADVETLAAGALGVAPPWDFDQLLLAHGLKYDEAERHTALGDARIVRDLYDAVLSKPTGGPA